MSVYPAIFALIGAFIMLSYPLNKKTMRTVENELIERRKETAGPALENS
jgi:Na+/melibiose symporter-like transporter